MKRFIVFTALALFTATASLTVVGSDNAGAATPEKKQKRKSIKTKKPAAATGAAAADSSTSAPAPTTAAANPDSEEEKIVKTELYTVKGGVKVDEKTMNGFRAWRAAACDRCHGANQEGLVGPSLLESMNKLSKEEFIVTVRDGRLEKGMQSFGTSKQVMDNIDNLYAYLKGRADGAITKAKVTPMQ